MDAKERIIEQRIAKRRKNALIMRTLIAVMIVLIVLFAVILIHTGIRSGSFQKAWDDFIRVMTGADTQEQTVDPNAPVVSPVEGGEAGLPQAFADEDIQMILADAARLAAQYNYSEAVSLLKESPGYNTNPQMQNAVASYQAQKDACAAYPVDQITHVFFHTLVKDTAKAFDGDANEAGYNQVMTTIDEFNSIISQMYEKGYVMVSVHDMCEVHEDGSVSKKEIRLPVGKIPFVLSQDDVSYYHYMVGDGFAQKLIVDENGKVKNTYIEDDGSISVGDYDMVPLIDTFVEEHPDFAYHGHKGMTRQEDRLTAYQRAFLDATPDFDWDKEVEEARKVADAMKAEGWEFASHTWGHINPVGYGYDATVKDTGRWLENVAPVVGDTDVLIFAFGADINDWTPYTQENEFFRYLKEKGFSIYCNVDGSQKYWVQFGSDYMRQGRRNLDGYRMYYNPEMLEDLFDVSQAWDEARPTPVPEM